MRKWPLSSSESECRLIAVSLITMRDEPYITPGGRIARRAILRGQSANAQLCFEFQTGLLNPEQIERCEALKEHGVSVVEVPTDWRYGYSPERGGWQAVVIRQALEQVAVISQREGEPMSGYDTDLAKQILAVLNKAFPQRFDQNELKYQLSPEPSDKSLYIAIEALSIDGLIEAKCMRQGIRNEIIHVAWVQLTARGRDLLTERNQAQTSPIFHGDQINVHAPVAAVGRHSQGVMSVQDSWNRFEPSIDLRALAVELEQLRIEFRKVAVSRDDDKQVALLGEAAEEAENGNANGVAAILANAGTSVLKVAKDIGTDVAAKVIAELMKG
jgi:hypothetical protein